MLMRSLSKIHTIIEIGNNVITQDLNDSKPEIANIKRFKSIKIDNDINEVARQCLRISKSYGGNMIKRLFKLLAYS